MYYLYRIDGLSDLIITDRDGATIFQGMNVSAVFVFTHILKIKQH